jgi:hypothetical protein
MSQLRSVWGGSCDSNTSPEAENKTASHKTSEIVGSRLNNSANDDKNSTDHYANTTSY